jgi:sugar phosphate isomerase/epimerase
MLCSIRDGSLRGKEFETPMEGLRFLGINAVEIDLSRKFEVCAMHSKETLVLDHDKDAADYARHLKELGVQPVAFLTACDFSQGDYEENVGWVARAVELAGMLGMPAIRIDSSMRRERELNHEERVDLFSKALGDVLKRTEGVKVAMGIENHGFQGNNLAFLLNVFKRVNSDRLGSTLDTGNFYWRGYPLSEVYGILRVLAPYAKHTHIKNINYPEDKREITREAGWEYDKYFCPIPDGDIDHAKVLKILKDAGYNGAICLEDESVSKWPTNDEKRAALKKDIDYLQKIIAEA